MNVENTLKNLVKGAITIAVPPVGGALWGKGKTIVHGVGMGFCLSIFASAGVFFTHHMEEKLIESPSVENMLVPKRFAQSLLEMYTSPLTFYADPTNNFQKCSIIDSESNEVYVCNDKISSEPISFREGRYYLNFDENTSIGYTFTDKKVSLSDAKKDIEKQRLVVEGYISAGDVIGGGKAKEDLEYLEAKLDNKQEVYEFTRAQFAEQVERLNSSLDSLASSVE